MMLARPLQIIGVGAVTVLRLVSLEVAIGFIVLLTVFHSLMVFVPSRNPLRFTRRMGYDAFSFSGKLGMVAFSATILAVFLYLMQALNFGPVGRWFASFGIAYYLAGVVAGVLNLPTMVAGEFQLSRLAKSKRVDR
jgi:hypothetical protein